MLMHLMFNRYTIGAASALMGYAVVKPQLVYLVEAAAAIHGVSIR